MTTPLTSSAEYHAGRAACAARKPRASCPYTKGAKAASVQRRDWLQGYDAERDGEPAPADPDLAHQLRNTNMLEHWILSELPPGEIPPTLATPGVWAIEGDPPAPGVAQPV